MPLENKYSELASAIGLTPGKISKETGIPYSIVYTLITGKGHSYASAERKRTVIGFIRKEALRQKKTIEAVIPSGPTTN